MHIINSAHSRNKKLAYTGRIKMNTLNNLMGQYDNINNYFIPLLYAAEG